MRMNDWVTVVGGGLAGCEAAWQLLKRGIPVRLVEMKPETYSPAHTMEGLAELVCSNSLKAEHLTNASGLLKAEMKKLDSLILDCAERARVPAGGALAVDRERFSREVTQRLAEHPLMRLERIFFNTIENVRGSRCSRVHRALWRPADPDGSTADSPGHCAGHCRCRCAAHR